MNLPLMKILFQAECLRLLRNRSDWLVLAIFLLVCAVSAVWAGLAAQEFREAASQQHLSWEQDLALRQLAVGADPAARGEPEVYAAEFARRNAPPAVLPAHGGLVLSIRQFDVLSADIRVSSQPRYSDGRFSDQIFNPLLQELGLLDFATVMALLLPLAVIALSYGLVQEAREQGIWRLVCAQSPRPWQALFIPLALRWVAVWAAAVLASLIAFLLDPEAAVLAALWWMLALGLYTLVWTLLTALLVLLPISSGASATGALGIWLVLTFIVPAAASWGAAQSNPLPSRLMAVIELRDAQEEAGDRAEQLTQQWYAANPQFADVSQRNHSRFVNTVARNLDIDEVVRPVMLAFDQGRARQFQTMQAWSWLMPGVGLLGIADSLAGIDAPAYLRYVEAVNAFEDEWREFFVPRIMSYQGLSATDYAAVPRFRPESLSAPALPLGAWLGLLVPCLLAGAVLAGRRRHLARV